MATRIPTAYIVNWMAAVAVAIVPLFFVKDWQQNLEIFFPIIGMLWLVIFDHVTNYVQQEKAREADVLQQEKLRAELIAKTLHAVLDAQVVTEFSLRAAHEYVALNAQRAIRIYNTRLARHDSELASVTYMSARDDQDEGFKNAVQQGTEYHLVFDVSHTTDVTEFQRRAADQNKKGGIVNLMPIDTHGAPMVQFIVLEYNGGVSECLMGYGLGDQITAIRSIYLIRSDALCNYLKHVHQMYYLLLGAKKSAG